MPDLNDVEKRGENNLFSKQDDAVSGGEAALTPKGKEPRKTKDWAVSHGEESERAEAQIADLDANRKATAEQGAKNAARIRRTLPDLRDRALALFTAGQIDFPDTKQTRVGDMWVSQPEMTDRNKVAVLNALFDGEEAAPHRDHFVGRIVDHEQRIIDEHYPVLDWMEAFAQAGLRRVNAKAAREILKEYALKDERNSLTKRLEHLIPEWDGQPRMSRKLIELFKPAETNLNEEFGEYFWLSLYARLMMPGSLAPMVLCLVGTQGCGKSLFGKRLAQIILGDPAADSVMLDLGSVKVDFLRDITGHSVIAAVGEMTGFTRGDLNKIKDFITRTSDPMHHKFEGHFIQQRQWIVIMDGNKYTVQRDDSGNRRFYPMFCGQLPDDGGQRRWSNTFSAAEDLLSADFDKDVWQLLAEARHWFETKGTEAYGRLVNELSKKVKEFSQREMAAERGTVDDELVGPYIDAALREVEKLELALTDKTPYIGIGRLEIIAAIDKIAGQKVSVQKGFGIGLNKAMHARGGGEKTSLPVKLPGGKRTTKPGYKFLGYKDVGEFYKALDARVGVTCDDDYIDARVIEEF